MPNLFQLLKRYPLLLWGVCGAGTLLFVGCDTELKKAPTTVEPVCTTDNDCSGSAVCELGECVSDPCKGVTCSEIPVASCNGNQVVTYGDSGECRGGDCFYTPKLDDCGEDTCEEGACIVDPCKDTTCATPPSSTCNGASVVTYSDIGTCSAGNCSYESTETACGTGEHCVNANCELFCNCTALQTCNEATGACQEPTVCLSNSDCNGARVCVFGSCTDEIPECFSNTDCTDGVCVEEILECEAMVCTEESDCTSQSHCKVDQGFCVECLDNSHCLGAQICEGNACEEPATCTGSDDCFAPQVCDGGECVNTICSVDDSFDSAISNNLHANASGLSFSGNKSGPHALRICKSKCVGCAATSECSGQQTCADNMCMGAGPGGCSENTEIGEWSEDDEWFEIDAADISENDGLVVSASFPAGSGRIEVFLMTGDEFSREIARGGGSTGQVLVSVDNVPAPPLFVRVHATDGTLIDIAFELEVFPGGLCGGDDLEPNNNSGGATALGANPISEGRAFLLCQDSNDEDWFSFSSDAGKTIEVRLASETDAIAGLDLYHSQNNVTTLIAKDISSNMNKLITHTSAGGVHFVRIYPLGPVHAAMSGSMSVNSVD